MTETKETRPGASLASGSPEAKRTARFLVARFEKWFLPRVAERLPRFILPDHLTGLGVLAASAISAAYMLSNHHPAWLWAANIGLVFHWLGDSLDGTLARVRHIQRPRYGFYLDHLTDAYSTVVIGLGLGLSPYMLLAVALALVAMYLVLSINVYLETYVLGEFRYGYGWLGPTEARIALILLNGIALTTGPLPFRLFGIVMTAYDVMGVVLVVSMIGLLLRRAARNLGTLGRLEPANVVKD
ncbi:MAG TPA: CDP-alcohol phosphatidyltransferase family protein [Candidatus Eisenbacteria bacterium]|nr:CDP-alcohol phosphatidyltransferase family protein [Candidatus Eisenbacteria bacterium]